MNFLLGILRSILKIYLVLYVLVHILLYLTPHTCSYLVFQNLGNLNFFHNKVRNSKCFNVLKVKWPFNDLKNPTSHGANNVHNFYLDIEPEVKIGIWHFIPPPLPYEYSKDSNRNIKEHFETYFKVHDERPVVIYSHGNDRDRAEKHRVNLCQNLANLGYHVFAIDYRGYGDSTGHPSEEGVVKDLMVLFNFIKSYQKQTKIFLWGHSLGTGITAHAAKILSEFNSPPNGVVLEAPFKNISQAAKEYIIAPLILNNPWIIKKGDEALEELNLRFNTAENILRIKSKILILHAQDDWFIPFDRSRELIEIAEQYRPREYPPVRLIELEKEHGFGHCLIYQHKEIYPVIKDFVESK